jgi:DNA topoisomerase-1
LISVGQQRIPSGRDFDSATGQLKEAGCLLLNEAQATELAAKLRGGSARVAELEDKPYTTRPYPPFTTSTLQQEANRKFGFTARRTMEVAQSLYENGHITYMRTDSTNLAAVAIDTARQIISSQYGKDYLPDQPRLYQTKVKNAQEAHEAIRPAGHPFPLPETLRNVLSPDEFRLYDLIWKRTVACQMSDAKGRRITIRVLVDDASFEASGKVIDFPGYLRAYVEGSDDPDSDLAGQDVVLPNVQVAESLACNKLDTKSHTTQPPNRFSEASLTRSLEEMGIGRPSTYASIIDTILARDYVFKLKRGNVLVPTWTAFAVAKLLEMHLPNLVDYKFTADMEDELDAISRGELGHVDYLNAFYFGKGSPGLKELVKTKVGEIDAREVCQVFIGKPEGKEDIFVRIGRYGPFLQQGESRARIPDETPPDELTMDVCLKLLETSAQSEEPLGRDDEGNAIYLRTGRFGPYVQRGESGGEEKPQNASLLKEMSPSDVTLEVALKLLSLPRELGANPQNGEAIVAHNGRYGPYVKCGTETRSLPGGLSPLDVSMEQAIELLAQPKTGRGRGAAVKKEPLKVFEASPVTTNPVQLLAGRYGPYVSDGVTNASLPRGTQPEEVTFEYALNLLKVRAETAPSPRPGRRGAKKAVAAKATVVAKKATKKATKKTTKKKKKT